MKPRIVFSGVNFTGMGPLTVFRDAIASMAATYADEYEIVALVHKRSLFDIPGVSFIEFPEIKSSWLKRLRFEYFDCRKISESIKPHLWVAMHDMTPNVTAKIRAVYCHNPSPFYQSGIKEVLLDWKFGLSTLLYRFLYGINIRANDFVVVQQEWMRSEFRSRYGVRNVVVAHPSAGQPAVEMGENAGVRASRPYTFFFPAYPRVFKNFEQILEAARRLESSGFDKFEVWLTINGTETRYAEALRRDYQDLSCVKWLGLLPHSEVMRLYDEADCLIFPSKLETWGMPITEFKATGKSILAVDLPYAHETVGEYGQAAFFEVGGDVQLSAMMRKAAEGETVFRNVEGRQIAQPFAQNWQELWKILLGE